jgi:hypothetical protein
MAGCLIDLREEIQGPFFPFAISQLAANRSRL